MEGPIQLFDGRDAIAATWTQTDDTVTITVPLPDSEGLVRPIVSIKLNHLMVGYEVRSSIEDSAMSGTAPIQAEGCVNDDGSSDVNPPKHITLLDNELGGEVSVEASTWTCMDGVLTIDLQKRPDFSGSSSDGVNVLARGRSGQWAPAGKHSTLGLQTPMNTSAPLRPRWWASAVRGGKSGPPDPKEVKPPQPDLQRLDNKIGEQVEKKSTFQGKSKFQW